MDTEKRDNNTWIQKNFQNAGIELDYTLVSESEKCYTKKDKTGKKFSKQQVDIFLYLIFLYNRFYFRFYNSNKWKSQKLFQEYKKLEKEYKIVMLILCHYLPKQINLQEIISN